MLEDRGRITESARILVPVDAGSQVAFGTHAGIHL